MKKKGLILACTLFFSVLSCAIFTSCEKDTLSYLDVKVIDEITNEPISNATVRVDTQSGNIEAHEGVTDANGLFQTSFTAPAVVNIKATSVNRTGKGTARLKEGQVVEAVVYIGVNI